MFDHQKFRFADIDQGEAAWILQKCYPDMAGSEALVRALVGSRTGNREAARFWAKVFLSIESVPNDRQ